MYHFDAVIYSETILGRLCGHNRTVSIPQHSVRGRWGILPKVMYP